MCGRRRLANTEGLESEDKSVNFRIGLHVLEHPCKVSEFVCICRIYRGRSAKVAPYPFATQAAASRADGSRFSEYLRCYSWPELPSTARFLQADATSVLTLPLIFMPTNRERMGKERRKKVSLDLHFLKQPPEVIVSFYSSRRLV